jgi:hypothetical protein
MMSWPDKILNDDAYVGIKQQQDNYNILESVLTCQPPGKQQMNILTSVTKSQNNIANYKNYTI